MQPIKLTIPGEYWDSQISSGRLYLFGLSGDITTLDWDRLSEKLGIEDNLHLAVLTAFERNDLLYDRMYKLLFHDAEVKNIMREKFSRLSNMDLAVSDRQFSGMQIGRQDNRFPFPHTDSQIYGRNIYISSHSGVYRATCNKKNKYPVSTRPEKKWDASVLALSAWYDSLALAAGDQGLFEMNLGMADPSSGKMELEHLSTDNCVDCNWTFYSIYGSSHLGPGYLAAFEKIYRKQDGHRPGERRFKSLISESSIFKEHGYSWGVQDKLCQAQSGRVHIVRYRPREDLSQQFQDLGVIELASWKGGVVSGGVASFGVVIECENAIVVLPSEGTPITFPGEPVNWRVFSHSKYYQNQLHIIYDDRMEIISFSHDYFVNQQEKRAGIEVYQFQRGDHDIEDITSQRIQRAATG
ncbi:MAG: hypothetical protein HQK60_16960 [Deltaproteobacteria bacterium]|nr:hypothetical protein [Deltaproteobacteria bacterium]